MASNCTATQGSPMTYKLFNMQTLGKCHLYHRSESKLASLLDLKLLQSPVKHHVADVHWVLTEQMDGWMDG